MEKSNSESEKEKKLDSLIEKIKADNNPFLKDFKLNNKNILKDSKKSKKNSNSKKLEESTETRPASSNSKKLETNSIHNIISENSSSKNGISPISKSIKSNSKFGENISNTAKPIAIELVDIEEKFKKNSKKYKTELQKYQKVTELNKKLASSYQANLNVMLDVSKLLNSYSSFFTIIKDQLDLNEKSLGELTSEDFSYLENLTKSKIEELTNSFMDESSSIKDLYKKFDMQDEYNRLDHATENFSLTQEEIANKLPEIKSLIGGKKLIKKNIKKHF